MRGLINIQFALGSDVLYVLEANPRASRTVPFVSKATGVQMAKAAARIGAGVESIDRAPRRLPECCRQTGDGGTLPAGRPGRGQGSGAAVQPVPHSRRASVVDSLLGPEMQLHR